MITVSDFFFFFFKEVPCPTYLLCCFRPDAMFVNFISESATGPESHDPRFRPIYLCEVWAQIRTHSFDKNASVRPPFSLLINWVEPATSLIKSISPFGETWYGWKFVFRAQQPILYPMYINYICISWYLNASWTQMSWWVNISESCLELSDSESWVMSWLIMWLVLGCWTVNDSSLFIPHSTLCCASISFDFCIFLVIISTTSPLLQWCLMHAYQWSRFKTTTSLFFHWGEQRLFYYKISR